ncbi:hypothetical protein IKG73_03360 [Candidatus Saccharibacteria bacterium]|nr:hypothetical protein [Candidatus Saccharibacteria bacterium]
MIIVEQSARLTSLKPLEERSFAEQVAMLEESERDIKNQNWSTLSNFTDYMERKYPRCAKAV